MANYTTIDDPSAYFQTVIYTGNATARSITFDGTSDMQPDWIWGKQRSGTDSHQLTDSVRGVTKILNSDTTAAENTTSAAITAFGSNGFSLGTGGGYNGNNVTQVAWNWKKTADAGFDIVSYSGNNSTNRQISHSLSAKPDMMLVKCRQSGLWKIYHSSLGATKYLVLEDTAAAVDNNSTWNDTEPTSSNFTLGDDGNVNETGETYINYLFAEKKGYSKFSSYKGNGNANGTFVFLGFEPAFVMFKRATGGAAPWCMHDSKRSPFNVADERLYANSDAVEASGGNYGSDFLSNGFKIRTDDNGWNQSGDTYIYMAFASNPFTTSTGVPATAR